MLKGAMPGIYEGGCHCGHVRFRVTGDLARVAECNCSICAKKGILQLVVAPEALELLSGREDLRTYCLIRGREAHLLPTLRHGRCASLC
jgi:hypothetical protein